MATSSTARWRPTTRAAAGPGRLEIAAALLLALSAVATAWSSYQASRWNGEQAKAAGAVNKARITAARADDLATSQTQVDIATFIEWVDAYAQQQHTLATFYRQRFREEFKPAFEAWIAARPLRNRDAPRTPFAMPEYRLAAEAEAARLDAQAEVHAADVRRYIQRSTNYVLGVVLFAVALFFAGVSTKLDSERLRLALLGVGWLVFAVALAWIVTSPVSVAV